MWPLRGGLQASRRQGRGASQCPSLDRPAAEVLKASAWRVRPTFGQPFSSGERAGRSGYRELAFLRVVEVFPPLFPFKGKKSSIDLEKSLDDLLEAVGDIRRYADLILVVTVKNPELLKVSSVRTAAAIQEMTAGSSSAEGRLLSRWRFESRANSRTSSIFLT